MTAPTPDRTALDNRDFKTVQGLVTEGQRLNEAIANMVAVAYEEVDGRNRPRGSAMGRLLHDVNGKIGQFWTVLELVEHRHADEIAAVTAERDQAEVAFQSDMDALRTELTEAVQQLDQARQKLADAPHDTANGCRYGWHKTLPDLSMGDPLPCTCWKAGL